MRSGAGLRRIPDPHLHTGADDRSRGAAYVVGIDALFNLFYDFPVADSVLLSARLAAMPRSQARARARGGAKGAR
jgi:hypothetical protein